MTVPDGVIADLERRLRPLQVEAARAWWTSNTESSPESERRRQEVELAVREILGDRDAFAAVTAALADADAGAGAGDEGARRRQLDRLHAEMVPNQLDPELRRQIVELETAVEGVYNTHRGEVDGRRVNDNEIAEILSRSDDLSRRRQAWEASKSVGAAVSDRVLELVRLRNDAARSLGHPDHYTMALRLSELDPDRLFAVLDEIDAASAPAFTAWKATLDEARAARFGCTVDDLRPWHYDDVFFQEPPRDDSLDLDSLFADADLVALTLQTYDALGMDLRPVLERSDLQPRDGKSQHAFCIDVDRQGDVRVLCNLRPSERWMGTMLHEFGHAAYDREIARDLPWFLHEPAHMLTTESVAQLFGRLVRDAQWLTEVGGLSAEEASSLETATQRAQRGAMLVFARWVLVMTHFERGLYQRPDDDHDTRWWDLVERYQLIRRPEGRAAPDWAAKIHLALAPVYYQNYLYGELMASQVQASIHATCGGLVGRPEAGQWLVERVFRPGASKRWDHLLADATGEPLTPAHFVREFCA